MEELSRKSEIIQTMTNVEFYPAVLDKKEVSVYNYTKLPLAKLPALGVAVDQVKTAIQNNVLSNSGVGSTSGLYKVTIPPGGRLAQFRDGSGFLGTVLDGNNQLAGQARLTPIVFDPVTLMIAAALMSIDKKLDSIQEMQKEILEFLEQKEKAKLRGNHNFLIGVLSNYKHNWNNDMFKNSNHIKVLDIKHDSEQSILFYREQIERKVKKQKLIHSDKYVNDKLMKIQVEFKEYQLALYLYAFSSFLDVMLLENFESAYLDGIVNKIEEYVFQYRSLYTNCYDQIEKYSKSSVESHLLSGVGSQIKAAGDNVSKIPIVKKSQINETLIGVGNRLGDFNSKRTAQKMEQLSSVQISSVHPFIDNIKTVNKLYNQPMELLYDNENIYLNLPGSVR